MLDLQERLSSEVRNALQAVEVNTLQELIKKARLISRNQELEKGRRAKATAARPRADQAQAGVNLQETSNTRAQSPRITTTTHTTQVRAPRDISKVVCFNCGKQGHYASSCPTKDQGNDNPTAKS